MVQIIVCDIYLFYFFLFVLSVCIYQIDVPSTAMSKEVKNGFNSFGCGEHLNSGLVNLASKIRKIYHPIVLCTTYFDILNRLGVDHQCDRHTDIRTDRRRDGQNYNSNIVLLKTCAKNLCYQCLRCRDSQNIHSNRCLFVIF